MKSSNQESDDSSTKPFPTGRSTPFPYAEPYPQQIDLMDNLVCCLCSGIVVVAAPRLPAKTKHHQPIAAESPTGTGREKGN